MISDASIAYALQQLVNAAPLASLYACLAFAYGLVFGLNRRADLTVGALFALSGQLLVLFAAFGWSALWLAYPAALAFGTIAAILYTLVVALVMSERVMARLADAGPNGIIIASVGLMIVLMEAVRIASDAHQGWLSPVGNTVIVLWPAEGFSLVVTPIRIIVTGLASALTGLAALVMARHPAGRIWRAVADEPVAAELMGVDVAAVRRRAGLASAAMAALCGSGFTIFYGAMDFGAGLVFGLKVVMIAAIGAASSPLRASLWAALFGVVESAWGAYLPMIWRDIALFGALVLIAVLGQGRQRA